MPPSSRVAMPIQILNSGVNLAPEPNTCSTVIFRDEAGVVCRTSANLQGRKTRRLSAQLLRRHSADAGGQLAGIGHGRQLTVLGAAPTNNGIGGNAGGTAVEIGTPKDMTSVFGLEVHRLRTDDVATEEPKKRRSRGSAAHKAEQKFAQPQPVVACEQRPETDGTGRLSTSANGIVTSEAPPEIWMVRAGGASRKPFPAHAALTERINQGNKLVRSVRAGRSLRQATRSSIKGALELGLWAASRPEEYVGNNLANTEGQNERPAATVKGAAPPSRVNKPRLAGDGGESEDSDGGGNIGAGSVRGEDRVRMLEGKLRAMDEQLARRARRPSIAGRSTGSAREAEQARNAFHVSHAGAAGTTLAASGVSGNRGGGGIASTSGMPRIYQPQRANDGIRGGKARDSSGAGVGTGSEHGAATSARGGDSVRSQDHRRASFKPSAPKLPLHLRDATMRTVAGDGRGGATTQSPPEGSSTSRSAPPAMGGARTSRPQGSSSKSGALSARKAHPLGPVIISAAAKIELKAAVQGYVLRQASLDNSLSDTIRRRDFDWDMDMRRMMDAVKIAAGGTEKRSFESVSSVMRRQVLIKKRSDEARNLQGSWFPSVMKRMLIVVGDKNRGAMPMCMIKLAAALHKVLVSGHMVTPSLFWSLVGASFQGEDHQNRAAQKMILACLTFVHQRPEDYHHFLLGNSTKVPRSLKQGFLKAHLKRSPKKGSGRKSQLGSSPSRLVLDRDLGGDVDDGLSVAGGGSRWGGTSVGYGSGGSDDGSDTMSVLSCMSGVTTAMTLLKEPPSRRGTRGR